MAKGQAGKWLLRRTGYYSLGETRTLLGQISSMVNMKKYSLATLCVVWCMLNIFILPSPLLVEHSSLSLPLQMVLFAFLTGIFIMPFILGTQEFDKLGKSLTVDNDLSITFAKISPLIFIYFMIISMIWYPKGGGLLLALNQKISDPNWWEFGIYALIIYYVASKTAVKPYQHVTSALLGIMAVQHFIAFYFWYRMDDGCRTDYDGYVECDDSYIQHADRNIEKASALNLTYESLAAAELFVVLIYSLSAYVVISIIKERLYP
jgi:hypothetical protein